MFEQLNYRLDTSGIVRKLRLYLTVFVLSVLGLWINMWIHRVNILSVDSMTEAFWSAVVLGPMYAFVPVAFVTAYILHREYKNGD